MSWATPAEASALTGHTITQSELTMAHGILEVYAGPVSDDRMENLKARDQGLLKKAESYQAAWMQSKPELFGRSDVDNVIQNSLQFSKADLDTHVLGPLAKKCLMKLSWNRARTIDPLTPEQALLLRKKVYPETYGKTAYNLHEDAFPWEQM